MATMNGGRWIRLDARLAIIELRDGGACVYCNRTIVDGVSLTLDHVIPRSQGGDNAPTNLVCACLSCNCSRQDKPMDVFLRGMGYSDQRIIDVLVRVETTTRKPMAELRKTAKAMLVDTSITVYTGKTKTGE